MLLECGLYPCMWNLGVLFVFLIVGGECMLEEGSGGLVSAWYGVVSCVMLISVIGFCVSKPIWQELVCVCGYPDCRCGRWWFN